MKKIIKYILVTFIVGVLLGFFVEKCEAQYKYNYFTNKTVVFQINSGVSCTYRKDTISIDNSIDYLSIDKISVNILGLNATTKILLTSFSVNTTDSLTTLIPEFQNIDNKRPYINLITRPTTHSQEFTINARYCCIGTTRKLIFSHIISSASALTANCTCEISINLIGTYK